MHMHYYNLNKTRCLHCVEYKLEEPEFHPHSLGALKFEIQYLHSYDNRIWVRTQKQFK